MDHPDEELPAIQLSLKSFVSIAQGLFSRGFPGDYEDFTRFVLTGRILDGEQVHRVFLNARQGSDAPAKEKYEVQHDLDSVVGSSQDLPYTVSMAIFPLASFRDTLTKDNHLTYTLPGCEVCFYW